jgi:hypothetical protein
MCMDNLMYGGGGKKVFNNVWVIGGSRVNCMGAGGRCMTPRMGGVR